MKRQLLFFTIVSLFLTKTGFSQNTGFKLDIPYIKITDSVLLSNIRKIIEREENRPSPEDYFKKGFGYISLGVDQFPQKKDTILRYEITPFLHPIKEDRDNLYPNYYSFVDNRLVLIRIQVLRYWFMTSVFTEKSKKHIRKLVEKSLEKNVPIYDKDGKKIGTDRHVKVDAIMMGNGISLYIMNNKPPIIRRNE